MCNAADAHSIAGTADADVQACGAVVRDAMSQWSQVWYESTHAFAGLILICAVSVLAANMTRAHSLSHSALMASC